MTNFIVLFLCLAVGLFARRLKNFPANTAVILNQFIIFVSFPALILNQFPKLLMSLDFKGWWWAPVCMAWFSFFISWLVFSFIGKKLKWSPAKTGALILTAGLGNTSFVGFPLLEALIGPHAIPTAVLIDQPGSFLVLSSLGLLIASSHSGATLKKEQMIKKVLTFPPFIALLLSAIWFLLVGSQGHHLFDFLFPPLEKIGLTLVPLALFSVGFQLKLDRKVLKKRWIPLAMGLTFKLLLVPALMALVYRYLFHLDDLSTQIVILESAMATMITAAVVVQEFNLDVEVANLMVGLSIPLSIVTVPLWNYLLF
jgi:predicted permease